MFQKNPQEIITHERIINEIEPIENWFPANISEILTRIYAGNFENSSSVMDKIVLVCVFAMTLKILLVLKLYVAYYRCNNR